MLSLSLHLVSSQRFLKVLQNIWSLKRLLASACTYPGAYALRSQKGYSCSFGQHRFEILCGGSVAQFVGWRADHSLSGAPDVLHH